MSFPVDLHTHTIASSHAYSSLLENIQAAKARGVRLFAMTDHGPAMPDAPHYWHFVNQRIIPRIVEGVGILRGIEANILNHDGEVDCQGRIRNEVDIVLGSFHEAVLRPTNQQDHTQALVRAIESGAVDIIAHPGNPSFPIDIETVVRAAAQHKVALEINNSSFTHSRPGSDVNCRAIAEAARDLGAYLSVGSDAHFASFLGDFAHAEEILAATQFPAERVLNTSPRALLDFLQARGHKPIAEFAQW